MKKDSFNANEIPADKGLSGNEKIEEAIAALQEEPSQELLAHTLTVIRRRMQEDGQLILAVEPPAGEAQLRIQAVQTSDGKQWWSAFTGFEEELKGSGSVMSTFLTEIRKLFESALSVNEIQGIILNPCNNFFAIFCLHGSLPFFLGENYQPVFQILYCITNPGCT
jgi:hypothetical protein